MTTATMRQEPSFPGHGHHLPTKSYAEAVVDGVDDESSLNDDEDAYRGENHRGSSGVSHKETNGAAKPRNRSQIIVERYRDKDGEHLVSFGPDWDRRLDKPRRRDSELLSGRKAGARWEQSQ